MADKYRFYNVGQANKEIERLEALIADRDSALASAQDKITSLEKTQTGADPGEIAQLKADLATAKQTIGTLEAAVKTHAATIAAKDKEIDDTKASVKSQASNIALGITASQGQPPIEAGPPKSDKPVNGQPGANLTEQCIAAKNQETSKK